MSVALAGDLAETHLTGDNAHVLPTDTQKNTVYAFAREHGVGSAEAFGLQLARHFVDSQPTIHRPGCPLRSTAGGGSGRTRSPGPARASAPRP